MRQISPKTKALTKVLVGDIASLPCERNVNVIRFNLCIIKVTMKTMCFMTVGTFVPGGGLHVKFIRTLQEKINLFFFGN